MPHDEPIETRSVLPQHQTSIWSTLQLLLAIGITLAVLFYLIFVPASDSNELSQPSPVTSLAAEQLLDGRIRISPGSRLAEKIQIVEVSPQQIATPLMIVTGSVSASFRPSSDGKGAQWQFDAPEVLTSYTDWQRSLGDVAFHEEQVKRIQELVDTRIQNQDRVVERLRKLVQAGTDSERDLAVEEAKLIEYRVDGRKQLHESQTELQVAKRSQASFILQLQQLGLDPALLQSASPDTDIVTANVPEGAIARVKIGQICEATFQGLEGQVLRGIVRSISTTITKDRRTLRVLFTIDDPNDLLRPGMFAEIGLGADSRSALLIPTTSLLHIGRSDYILVQNEPSIWSVQEVKVGEVHPAGSEILTGLKPGDQVIANGAILLKPHVVDILDKRKRTTASLSNSSPTP